jgi:tetratricopeptide (TPR) repeat protein
MNVRTLVPTLAAALCIASGALAEARDPAAAELLFRQGRAALQRGEYEEACSKLGESQRLDPAAGTLMNLATCEEKLGKIASAWQHFREAMDALPADDDRVPFAASRVQVLEGRLPYLTIRLAPKAPTNAEVARDGIPLGQASLAVALPVDPGEHVVTAGGKRYEKKSFRITIAEGERKELTVAPGALLPDPPAPDMAGDAGSGATLGWVIGGVGVAGIATGVVTGLMLPSRRDTVEEQCRDGSCSQQGLDAASEGRTLLIANTAGWIVGIAGIGAGAWLIWTNSDDDEKSTTAIAVQPQAAGASVSYRGVF